MDKKDEQTSQNSFPVDQPRTKHYSGIPLMSCGFFPSGELLVGGGGGNSNSGIPNALVRNYNRAALCWGVFRGYK